MRLILDGLYTTTLRVPVRPERITCIAYHHLFIGLAARTLSDSEKGNQAAEKRAKKQQHLFRVPLVYPGARLLRPFPSVLTGAGDSLTSMPCAPPGILPHCWKEGDAP